MNAAIRKEQAENAYGLRKRTSSVIDYVLVDDVWTTGSSMMAACRELQKEGKRNISVVLIAKSR